MKPYIKRGIYKYLTFDYFTALLSWALFFILRKIFIDKTPSSEFPYFLKDDRFFLGILLIPVCWIIFYFLIGTYTNIYRKSRFAEITVTLLTTLAGVIIIFFTLLINDRIRTYQDYYQSVALLFFIHFILTYSGRLLVLNNAKNLIRKGKVGFNTIIVGGNKRAVEIYKEIISSKNRLGYNFIGFIDTNGSSTNGLSDYIPRLGKQNLLETILSENEIEEVIVAIETSEHPRLNSIINTLVNRNVVIKIIPDMYDILSGSVKLNHLLGAVFIEIYPELMPRWQYILKRILDICCSLIAILFLWPVYILCAIRVALSSKGPIIYSQERIGLHGKPFHIYKFRSMVTGAEPEGPALSQKEDPRITSWGRVMRKWRLDELPQFYNVLRGDMSVVGPRPERKHYIDLIVSEAPDYKHLQRVQPGITSWGMVKYGYAENLEQMIIRMKYDLIYIENMSPLLDLKILLYTLRTIIQGRGL